MKKTILITSVVLLAGCGIWATAKPILRGIHEIAVALCESAAADAPPAVLGGKTVKGFCEVEKNLQPFIDSVLMARRAAAVRSGLVRP